MTFRELVQIEKRENKLRDRREERRLLPVDHASQLDTGYTGRGDGDLQKQDAFLRERHGIFVRRPSQPKDE